MLSKMKNNTLLFSKSVFRGYNPQNVDNYISFVTKKMEELSISNDRGVDTIEKISSEIRQSKIRANNYEQQIEELKKSNIIQETTLKETNKKLLKMQQSVEKFQQAEAKIKELESKLAKLSVVIQPQDLKQKEKLERAIKDANLKLDQINQKVNVLQNEIDAFREIEEHPLGQKESFAEDTFNFTQIFSGVFEKARETADEYIKKAKEDAEKIILDANEAEEAAQAEADRVLAQANEITDEILKEAEVKKGEVLTKAQSKIAQINEDAQKILAKAKSDASDIISGAMNEADSLRGQAEIDKNAAIEENERVIALAKAEAEAVLQDARSNAEVILKESQYKLALSEEKAQLIFKRAREKAEKNIGDIKIEYDKIRNLVEKNIQKYHELVHQIQVFRDKLNRVRFDINY